MSETYKCGKWAREILSARDADGLWGNFHTLSMPVSGKGITTEQAIRRLWVLGFDKEDEAIKAVLDRMCRCVLGERKIDDYREKRHDWDLFEKLMLSAWIRIFDPKNEAAKEAARFWGGIAEKAFAGGRYDEMSDRLAFEAAMGRKPKSGFETGFGMFYHAALLCGMTDEKTQDMLLDYYISRPGGIYYIYDKPLCTLPKSFASKEASRYLAAIEVLAGYENAPHKLKFVTDWLMENRGADGMWDMGKDAKDGVYFPLSDSWRKEEYRKADCTKRIGKLLDRLKASGE